MVRKTLRSGIDSNQPEVKTLVVRRKAMYTGKLSLPADVIKSS